MTAVELPLVDGAAVVGRPSPWIAGARATLPYAIAFSPFGLAIGAVVSGSGIDPLAGWSTSWLLYGGTSQILGIELASDGASLLAVAVTLLAFNLRLVAFAAALAPRWRDASRGWVAAASYVLIDPVFLVAEERWHADDDVDTPEAREWHRRHYLAAAVTLWSFWLVVCALGLVVGTTVTQVIPTGAVGLLMLSAMAGLMVRDRDTALAAGLGLVLGVPAVAVPGGVGPVVAASIAIGVVVARRRFVR